MCANRGTPAGTEMQACWRCSWYQDPGLRPLLRDTVPAQLCMIVCVFPYTEQHTAVNR